MGGLTEYGVNLDEILEIAEDMDLSFTLKDMGYVKLLQVFGPNEILEVEFKNDHRYDLITNLSS